MSSNHRILLDFKITQADFAALVGVSEGAVSAMFTDGRLERGNPARVWLRMVDWFISPKCAIVKAPDQEAMLAPSEFAVRWHGWENTPTLNAYALDQARDWDDIAIHGFPDYPDDE